MALTVVAASGCFGVLVYWLWSGIDQDCQQWVSRGLYAECLAPAGLFVLIISAIFALATAALAYLALRRR